MQALQDAVARCGCLKTEQDALQTCSLCRTGGAKAQVPTSRRPGEQDAKMLLQPCRTPVAIRQLLGTEEQSRTAHSPGTGKRKPISRAIGRTGVGTLGVG
jgi:hypothetical protein